MIIWINGAFGAGKSTLATGLMGALPGAVTADPEAVGDLLRTTLRGHNRAARDYQDLPPWRSLTLAFVTALADHTRGPVIVPMTVLDPVYATELFTPLHRRPAPFHHLVLHTGPAELRARIEASREYPGDLVRSEAARAFRRRRAGDYQQAAAGWMHAHGHVIDTSFLTPGQTLQAALHHSTPPADRYRPREACIR
ncbi:AAA family ATPase, partial [Streptomyces clavuligerus]|uniref:AAA family ATPase n=2 Tax=Streptomyces clavuligerus TaxID=1901 RepID=UPI0027DE953D